MSRTCAACKRSRSQTSYTAREYAKGRGVSRCVDCKPSHSTAPQPQRRQSDGGRYNYSQQAQVSESALDNPIAQGAFRWVAKGTYTSGPRAGQACVVKWFKTGAVFSKVFFAADIKAVDKALEIVNKFNQRRIINKLVKINVPEVVTFSEGSRRAGQRALWEPFIQNYQKFNSNSGWADNSSAWGEVMQALSHFSFDISGGRYVLCDLQGGIYQHEIILSDPVILSQDGLYGVTDTGPDGISTFFSNHTCNKYCRPYWIHPSKPRRVFGAVPGTIMINRPVPTAYSRPSDTRAY